MSSLSNTEAIKPKKQSLLRSTSLVSVMTFLSRIMGFLRDMTLAQIFGASSYMDAFLIAFRIPNFMRRLFAEGAFSQAFVPVLAQYQETRSIDEVRLFLARIAGTLSAVLTLVTLIGIIASPLIVNIFAPGFGDDSVRSILASEMLRLTFPYLMLISLTAMAGAILNTYGYFGVPAFTPVFLNISLIIAAVFISPHFNVPVMALAWGVLLAGILQLLFQIPFLFRHRLLVTPKLGFIDKGVKKVLKLMVPALFGVSVAQVNLLVDTIFASFLPIGSVSWLFFTDRLTDFPLGVFGVAIATVILPHLSRKSADQDVESYSRSLDWGLRLLLLIGVPSAVGLMFFAIPLISSCFAYGKFTNTDVLQTAKSLFTLGLGVPAFMLVKVLASGFYAKQNIATPVKVGALAMLVNTICCALLIIPLQHAGLTLASTIAGFFNAGVLLYLLVKRDIFIPMRGWVKYLLRLIFANFLLLLYLSYINQDVNFWLNLKPFWRISYLLGFVALGAVIYVLGLFFVGLRISQFRKKH